MIVKFASLMFPKKIATWVLSPRYFSSISSTVLTQTYPEEPHKKVISNTEIDHWIQYLKNDLCPDSLIRVLDNTNYLNSAISVFNWASLQKQFKHTPDTYSNVILKLGLAGNLDEMEGFCNELVKFRGGENALEAVLDVFVSNHRLDEAIRVVLVMNTSRIKLSVGKWNNVLNALVVAKRGFRDVLLVYMEMVKSGTFPNVDTLNSLIKALLDANMVDKAYDQFRRMKKKKCIPNSMTFEIVINGLIASNRVDESMFVMNLMFEDGVNPDSTFCSNIIPLLTKENKLEHAVKLFELMKSLNYTPDFSTYEELIKCLCINHRFNEAIQLSGKMQSFGFDIPTDIFQQMKEKDWILDHYSYTELFKGLCNIQKFPEALELFKYMSARNSGLSLDVETYCVFLQSMVALNQIKYCVLFLNQMVLEEDLVPNYETLGIVVQYIARHSELHSIWDCVRKVCRESEVIDSDMYNLLINGLYKEGCKSEACLLLDYMLEKGWVPDGVTHGLLIGTGDMQTDVGKDGFGVGDEVSSILSEGLGDAEDNTVVT